MSDIVADKTISTVDTTDADVDVSISETVRPLSAEGTRSPLFAVLVDFRRGLLWRLFSFSQTGMIK